MKTFATFVITLLLSTTLAMSADVDAWQWQPSLLPRARVYEGLWSEFFQVEPALRRAGIPSTFVSITALPKEETAYTSDAVIVLVNTAAPHLTAPRVARIREFVAAGGGLVVLAGQSAFCRGGYADTPLGEILPVTFPPAGSLRPIPKGIVLSRAPSATWLQAADYSPEPRTYFIEAFTPKPGSVVQMMAGDKPAIVSGTFGKGRVVAISIMVNGEAQPSQLAFWDWPQWPALLGQSIDWAAGGRPLNVTTEKTAGPALKPLTLDETKDLSLGLSLPDNCLARAGAHPTGEIAQGLFEYAFAREATTKVKFPQILSTLLPFAKAEWGPRLVERTDMNANRADRDAAYVLLGATRWPGATAILLKALTQPDSKVAAIEGLGRGADPSVIPQLKQLYDKTILSCLLPGEKEWFNPAEFSKSCAPVASEAALALYRLGDPTGLDRLLTMNRRVQLYWRIFHTAGRRNIKWDDPTQIAMLHSIWDHERNLAATLEKLHRPNAIPSSQLAAFQTTAQSVTDAIDADWIIRQIEPSPTTLPPAGWQSLATAKDGVIARLARTIAGKP